MLKKLNALFLISGMLLAQATAADVLDGGTINLKTIVNKPFAGKLVEHTGLKGVYKKVAGPQWLEISEDGILFGTPTVVETVEFYFSVSTKMQEDNYRVLLAIDAAPVQAKYEWVVKVGDVFKANLAELEGIKGTYGYKSLPQWLNADATGLLYGVPDKTGVSQIQVTVNGVSFDVRLDVRPKAELPKGIVARAGERLTIDVFKSVGQPGLYRVTAPYWLRFYANGLLDGIVPWNAAGTHTILVSVQQGWQVRDYYLTVVVQP